jgi:hypothetical protein
VKGAMLAAFRLRAKEGMARSQKQAELLEREYPSSAASLREGVVESRGISPRISRPGFADESAGAIRSSGRATVDSESTCRFWRTGSGRGSDFGLSSVRMQATKFFL